MTKWGITNNGALMAAALFLGAFFGMQLRMTRRAEAAPPVPAVIKARAFQLLDEAGKVRAELAFRTGMPGLYLYDTRAALRLVARIDDQEDPQLYVLDSKTIRAMMGVGEKSGAYLILYDDKDKLIYKVPPEE